MNNSIFREKSIQKVQSPDNLNEYIRVSNPGIWILMVSIVFLLLGLCIWGCFGQLRTEVQGQAVCENGVVSCLLPDENAAEVQPGMTAELGGRRLNGKMAAVGNSSYLWKVLHLPMEFFSQRMSGDIQSRQASNAAIANSLINTLAPLLLNAGMMVFYLVLMLRYSWVLTAVGLTGLTINAIVSNYITRKRTNLMRLSMQDNAKLYSTATAGIELIESIKAGGAENGYFAKWAGYQANVNAADVRTLKINQYLGVIPQLVSMVANNVVVLLGVWLAMQGQFTVGMIMAFQGFLSSFMEPAMTFVSAGQTLQEMRTQMERGNSL
ncbi:MAG: ABC transporter transmembrane domain-containing protein [Ruminiclostridium sp.]